MFGLLFNGSFWYLVDAIAFGRVHGNHQFADSFEVGSALAALDSIERLGTDSGSSGQLGLRKTRGSSSPDDLLCQSGPIQIEARLGRTLIRDVGLVLNARLLAQLLEKSLSQDHVPDSIQFNALEVDHRHPTN